MSYSFKSATSNGAKNKADKLKQDQVMFKTLLSKAISLKLVNTKKNEASIQSKAANQKNIDSALKLLQPMQALKANNSSEESFDQGTMDESYSDNDTYSAYSSDLSISPTPNQSFTAAELENALICYQGYVSKADIQGIHIN